MPDRFTNTIDLVGGGLANRPTIISNYDGDMGTAQKWWAAWRDYVAYEPDLERLRLDDAPAPGPIGNEPLGIRVRGELVLRVLRGDDDKCRTV